MNYVSVCFLLLSDPRLTSGDPAALQSAASPGPYPALTRNYMLESLLVCAPLQKGLIFRAIKSQQYKAAQVCPFILHPPAHLTIAPCVQWIGCDTLTIHRGPTVHTAEMMQMRNKRLWQGDGKGHNKQLTQVWLLLSYCKFSFLKVLK